MLVKEKFRGGIMKEQEFMSYWKTHHRDLQRQRPNKSKADPEIISSQQESCGSDGFDFGGEDDSSFLSKQSSSRSASRMSVDRAASAGSAAGREVRGAASAGSATRMSVDRAASAGSAAGREVRGAASAGIAVSNEVNMAAFEALKKEKAERENDIKTQLAETVKKAMDERDKDIKSQLAAMFQMFMQEFAKKIDAPTVGSYFLFLFLLMIIYILL